mgnify:CR=1 FL=1
MPAVAAEMGQAGGRGAADGEKLLQVPLEEVPLLPVVVEELNDAPLHGSGAAGGTVQDGLHPPVQQIGCGFDLPADMPLAQLHG